MRHTIELNTNEEEAIQELAGSFETTVPEILKLVALETANAPQLLIIGRKGVGKSALKAMLRQALEATAEQAIRSTAAVVGGDACVGNTRIPVWTLVDYRRQGLTDAQILEAFPVLNIADLTAAYDYYVAHGDEVDLQWKRHEDAA